MTIGIDISPLQGPHRMRGIGFTLINYINSLPDNEKKNNHYVFFTDPDNNVLFKNPLELINYGDLDYEIRNLRPIKSLTVRLPWKFDILINASNSLLRLKNYYTGDSRLTSLKDIDVFMQFDQSQPLPKARHLKKILILYDIIPYVLEWDYLVSYKTARNTGHTFKGSVRRQLQRYLYIKKLRISVKKASSLVAISEVTKRDFVKYTKADAGKISVIPLGVTMPSDTGEVNDKKLRLKCYLKSSWGYIKRPLKLDKPYLLFVGGTDPRRKLEDLIASFNLIRARGHEIKLVLVGDVMLGPDAITNLIFQKALLDSSYLDDIIFMGFVDDQTRNWLYKNASAFVFTSRYEGFGLPILEAMSYGTPVVTYRNYATAEIAGDAVIYVSDFVQMSDRLINLLKDPHKKLLLSAKAIRQAKKYTWSQTANAICQTYL